MTNDIRKLGTPLPLIFVTAIFAMVWLYQPTGDPVQIAVPSAIIGAAVSSLFQALAFRHLHANGVRLIHVEGRQS